MVLYNATMNAHCFIDGGYVRGLSKRFGKPLINPRTLANNIAYSGLVQLWGTPKGTDQPKEFPSASSARIGLTRVIYYDARPDEGVDPAIQEYWKAIELLPDTEIGFGALRGRPRRQKRVDGLIAVDMLEGAFSGLFQVAILVAGDSDFVPIVEAVRRRGVMTVVAAEEGSLADELRREADRVWPIDVAGKRAADFPRLQRHDGYLWIEKADSTVYLGPETA
jgi:uncharacterized LabA/DUF88 family protein